MSDTVIAIGWADRPAPAHAYPWLADLDAAIEDMKVKPDGQKERRYSKEADKVAEIRLPVLRVPNRLDNAGLPQMLVHDEAYLVTIPVAVARWGRQELHRSTNPKYGLRPRKRRRLPFRRWFPRFSFHGPAKWR